MNRTIFGVFTVVLLTVFVQSTYNDVQNENVDDRIRLSSAAATTPLIKEQFTILEQRLNAAPESQSAVTLVAGKYNKRYMTFHETRRHPIASLTKLMTAVIAQEIIDNQTIITISNNAVATEGPAGDFDVGELYNVHDLIAAMITVSSNDAAAALAEQYDSQIFVDLMQQKAKELGMNDTTFVDTTGLSSLDQSTALDLKRLVDYIREEHPNILELSRRKETVIVDQRTGSKRLLNNINEFAGQYDFLGGKTGYTPEAKGNLISLFRVENDELIIIMLGTDDRFGETRKLYDWVRADN